MVIDVLYDDDGNFLEQDGDFVFGNDDAFLMEDLLLASPGQYKEFPTLGANVTQYLNSTKNVQVIARDIIVALEADVFKKPLVNLNDFPSTIEIDNVLFELQPQEDV